MDAGPKKIKVVFIGDSCSGKTQLISTYLRGAPAAEPKPTLFENYFKDMEFDGVQYRLYICDTGGMSDFSRLKRMAYLNTDVFVLCVDYSQRDGLRSSEKWLQDLKKIKTPILLCLTKADLQKRLDKEDIQSYANKHRIREVVSCSSANRRGLRQLFEMIVRQSTEGSLLERGYGCSCCGYSYCSYN